MSYLSYFVPITRVKNILVLFFSMYNKLDIRIVISSSFSIGVIPDYQFVLNIC